MPPCARIVVHIATSTTVSRPGNPPGPVPKGVAMSSTTAHYEIDGHAFADRIEAMAYADVWGYHYGQIVWIDPEAPWA